MTTPYDQATEGSMLLAHLRSHVKRRIRCGREGITLPHESWVLEYLNAGIVQLLDETLDNAGSPVYSEGNHIDPGATGC